MLGPCQESRFDFVEYFELSHGLKLKCFSFVYKFQRKLKVSDKCLWIGTLVILCEFL